MKVNFNSKDSTSDSSLILTSKFDEKIVFSKIIINVFKVNDLVNHKQQKTENILIQKIYQVISGCTTENNSD